MVTSPAPARSAPRAASRAAPVVNSPPDATTQCPRVYLCPSGCGTGKPWRQSAGELIQVCGVILSRTTPAIPICATWIVPQCSRPGSSACPSLRRKNVTVVDARTAVPMTAPVVPLIPLGRSIACTQEALFMASIMARGLPSTGRSRPAPNSASMTTSSGIRLCAVAGSYGPLHRCAASRASPRNRPMSPTSSIRTRYPRSLSRRPATSPSPPLLPGPATTAMRVPGGWRLETWSATARPAFSMSSMPAIPPAIVNRSACAISAVVSNSVVSNSMSRLVVS